MSQHNTVHTWLVASLRHYVCITHFVTHGTHRRCVKDNRVQGPNQVRVITQSRNLPEQSSGSNDYSTYSWVLVAHSAYCLNLPVHIWLHIWLHIFDVYSMCIRCVPCVVQVPLFKHSLSNRSVACFTNAHYVLLTWNEVPLEYNKYNEVCIRPLLFKTPYKI